MLQVAPLLFYAIAFFLGIASALVFHPIYIPLFCLLLFLWKKRILSGIICYLCGVLFAFYSCSLPNLPEDGLEGSGIFQVTAIQHTSSPFSSAIMTHGTLETFASWKRIPCMIYTMPHQERPIGGRFHIEGRLLPKTPPHYVLKPTTISPLSLPALPEWRFHLKEWTRAHFEKLFPDPAVSSFLLSMVTGEVDDRTAAMQFNKLGLLHLLGISGFQFSLLALLLGSLLRLFLPCHFALYTLALLLTAYAFLLGNSPPIQRAYLTILLYLIAERFDLQISPLNAFGGALMWVLLLDPLSIFHLGFQFSFLCTAAIVMIYPALRPKPRPLASIYKLPFLDRFGNLLLFVIKGSLALNCAIHLITAPLLFYHFHKLPALSILYNLFLPAIVSVAYLFLIPGLMLYPVVPLFAKLFLKVTHFLTAETLLIAGSPITPLDFQIRSPLSFVWTVICVAGVLGVFVYLGCLKKAGLYNFI